MILPFLCIIFINMVFSFWKIHHYFCGSCFFRFSGSLKRPLDCLRAVFRFIRICPVLLCMNNGFFRPLLAFFCPCSQRQRQKQLQHNRRGSQTRNDLFPFLMYHFCFHDHTSITFWQRWLSAIKTINYINLSDPSLFPAK